MKPRQPESSSGPSSFARWPDSRPTRREGTGQRVAKSRCQFRQEVFLEDERSQAIMLLASSSSEGAFLLIPASPAEKSLILSQGRAVFH